MKITRFFPFMFLSLIACEGPAGPEGPQSLVAMLDEPAGIHCATGGVRITSGIDRNDNDVLDETEVTLTKYACNGTDGLSTLLATDRVGPNEACGQGGLKLTSGQDKNANGKLDAAEIEVTQYVCDGSGMKVLRIDPTYIGGFSTSSSPDTTVPYITGSLIPGFNADFYANYDSIIFITTSVNVIKNSGNYPPDFDHEIGFELVDGTHGNATIPGSRMMVKRGSILASGNLAGKFPSGYFDLGTKAWAADPGYYGSGSLFFLLFNRN